MTIEDRLVDKSKEAFMMAIEVYNKPTIRYRVEGFGFFICNAWELMLKAHLIKQNGMQSIYYKDNPARTITLELCVEKVFTNDKDPLRRNLEKIIELRNISTHFITEEYEMLYVPLFQACVFNYIEKMQAFHVLDISEFLPPNFLTLAVSLNSINYDEIRAKYPAEIAEKLIATNNALAPVIDENNNRFAIRIDHHYYITKNKDKATVVVGIDNNAADSNIKIVKELKDPNDTHKYTCKRCCLEINRRFAKMGITWRFNQSHFNLFCKYYNIKENNKLCYVTMTFSQPQYSYSQQAIDFIVDEIKKDPDHIIRSLREKIKK